MELETVTFGKKQWQMIRTMIEFHDDDPDLLQHLDCTETEWSELKAKFVFEQS